MGSLKGKRCVATHIAKSKLHFVCRAVSLLGMIKSHDYATRLDRKNFRTPWEAVIYQNQYRCSVGMYSGIVLKGLFYDSVFLIIVS